MDSGRVDSWIWAVRLLKTRSQASSQCRAGHVTVNGAKAKPAQSVKPGDEVRVRNGPVERIVTVSKVISKRVAATVAVECYIDLTPPPPPREETPLGVYRDPGSGRPTKRQRRDIDRLLGR